ncbi:ddd73f1f-742a-4757-be5b-9fa3cc2a2153-CDS [Sclerotinia trifoliorum]|uniref:Ddd73f1f-742a-4757-be5b-9fa3cc2a2153-CDS n=1 Tax=Sclerotinia trifoliorum TaxID=28548 RepID=A0A8H2ZRK3_9HELO|nr:ddd73f1f-742a-4757-be5b-9fa3cc2a2153-CDS [Sclerotinia trifoliorum]
MGSSIKQESSIKQDPAQSAAPAGKFFDWQRTSRLTFSREMVTMTVGVDKDAQEFLVHEELITHLQARLFIDVRMSRVGDGPLKGYFGVYQQLQPEVFIGLLHFAYHGKLFRETSLDTLWHLYIYAENYRLVDFQDILMNRIVSTYKNSRPSIFPNSRHMQLGYNRTGENSAARRFLTKCYAHLLNRNTKSPARPVCYNEILADAAKNADGLLLDTLNLMKWKGTTYNAEWDPRDASPCLYHHHALGTKCPNFQESA